MRCVIMKSLLLSGLLAWLLAEIPAFALPGQMDASYASVNLQWGLNSLLVA